MRLVCLLALMALLVSPARAQVVGSCETGQAERFLETPEVKVALFNTGGLFFGGSTTSGDGYLIPKATGNSPFFAGGLWLGGQVDGDVRVAGARYGDWDFWPGPLDDAATPPEDCSAYDRIFLVSRQDIARYLATGELTDDLRDWPHQLGAPVIDGDGIEGNYDLAGGDQPDLIGDMAAWWVMNDAGGDHGISSPSGPIGVEVRVLAFVYGTPGDVISPVLTQTLFVRYDLVNRNDQPIEQMYASLFADPDLGDAGDDYIGADTLRNMGIVYNGSNEDSAYGVAPPAVGMQILKGPVVGEDTLEMTSVSTFVGGGADFAQDASTRDEFYNYMQGFWADGTLYHEREWGYEQPGVPTTRFMYPGDPVTESFWSEVNVDGNGTDSPTGDRRMVVTTGPFQMDPDSSQTLLYAFPYGRGSSNLQSVAVLQGRATTLQRVAASGAFDTGQPVANERAEPTFELTLSQVRPNPSRQPEATLTLPEEAHVRASVFDALGRQLVVLVDGELAAGETALVMPSGLATGTYLLRVEVPGATETLSFTVVR